MRFLTASSCRCCRIPGPWNKRSSENNAWKEPYLLIVAADLAGCSQACPGTAEQRLPPGWSCSGGSRCSAVPGHAWEQPARSAATIRRYGSFQALFSDDLLFHGPGIRQQRQLLAVKNRIGVISYPVSQVDIPAGCPAVCPVA